MRLDLPGDPTPWLLQADPRQTMYVYRLEVDGKPIKSYLVRSPPYADLFVDLQAIHGGGEFRILIREGRTMVVSADVAIEPLPRP